jgi:hypothetical protein
MLLWRENGDGRQSEDRNFCLGMACVGTSLRRRNRDFNAGINIRRALTTDLEGGDRPAYLKS